MNQWKTVNKKVPVLTVTLSHPYLTSTQSPNQGAPTGVCSGAYQPSAPLDKTVDLRTLKVSKQQPRITASCANKPVVNPAELLPKDMNSEWAS